MKKSKLILVLSVAVLLAGCKGQGTTSPQGEKQETPDLVGDSALNNVAKFYAEKVDHSKCEATLQKVEAVVKRDMGDLRDSCDVLYYPFSGPDFFFPITMFPNADTYLMFGLEKTGKPLTSMDPSTVSSYTQALSYYLGNSYFITSYMQKDLHNKDVGGVVPIIEMLMAKKDCEIISVNYMQITDDGRLTQVPDYSNVVEIKFFAKSTPKHEQRVVFMSGNVEDGHVGDNVMAFIGNTLKGHKVVTFLKAASYILYNGSFSKIRNSVLDNSMAVLQDDSGIPYKYFENWDRTLYGKYYRPLKIFGMGPYQTDLNEAYKKPDVRPLDFRVGYNNPSNWMLARKK